MYKCIVHVRTQIFISGLNSSKIPLRHIKNSVITSNVSELWIIGKRRNLFIAARSAAIHSV